MVSHRKTSEPYVGTYLIARPAARVVSTYFFVPLHVRPNLVSLLSLASGLYAVYAALASRFGAAVLLIWLWLVLDCADGEVARATNRTSDMGGVIEGLNSNIMYSLFVPSLAIGLHAIEALQLEWVFGCFIGTSIFAGNRHLLSRYPAHLLGTPSTAVKLFAASQFKNGEPFRRNSRAGRWFFAIWRNTMTQGGLLEVSLAGAVLLSGARATEVVALVVMLWTLQLGLFFGLLVMAVGATVMYSLIHAR